jgi:hypothetical protein
MDIHTATHDYATNPQAALTGVPSYATRSSIVLETAHLNVYATEGFTLRPVCTLDDLRMVTNLLSALYLGHAIQHLEDMGLENHNPEYPLRSYMGKTLTPAEVFELIENHTSYKLHMASVMAFMEGLPYSPKLRGSRYQTLALLRLATAGERIKVSTVSALDEADHRHLEQVYELGTVAMTHAGRNMSPRLDQLIRDVLARIGKTKTLIVLSDSFGT